MTAVDEQRVSVVLIVGPGVNINQANLKRWCNEWGSALSADVDVAVSAEEDMLVARIRDAVRSHAQGIVLCPGTAGASEKVLRATSDADVPVVWVDLNEAERPRPIYIDRSGMAIRGRGVDGFRWALRLLLQRIAWPYETIAYGSLRDQVGDLRLPSDSSRPAPVVVLLHGGFWRERWERDTIEPLAIDLARRGYATWNIEYRRHGPFGGGWPTTCEDVAVGIDFLARLQDDYPIDVGRRALIGHSAGGHLALWAAKRGGVATSTLSHPSLIVSLAGIADVVEAAHRGLGDTGNGTADFMGARPEEAPTAYADASPANALPLGVPQLIVQGRLDNTPDLVDLSPSYVELARESGDEVVFIELDDADHFDVIDPNSAAWLRIVEEFERRFPLGGQNTTVNATPNSGANA